VQIPWYMETVTRLLWRQCNAELKWFPQTVSGALYPSSSVLHLLLDSISKHLVHAPPHFRSLLWVFRGISGLILRCSAVSTPFQRSAYKRMHALSSLHFFFRLWRFHLHNSSFSMHSCTIFPFKALSFVYFRRIYCGHATILCLLTKWNLNLIKLAPRYKRDGRNSINP